MATKLQGSGPATANLPADLREYFGEDRLLELTLDAVQTRHGPNSDATPKRDPSIRPPMMLTLLTYCYAARIYGSRDIEWAIWNDPLVRYICAHAYPDWRAIRRFRRQNRELIQQCLAYVLKQGWALQCHHPEDDYDDCHWPESELNRQITAAVQDKIEVAVIMDLAESGD